MGQTIKLPAGNYTSLQVLAVAAGGEASEKGTFKVGYKSGKGTSKTLSIRDWIAEFYTLQGDLKGWDAPIKENIASVLTHRHTSKGDDTCRTTYLFKYDIPLSPSKMATTLILPKNDKIKVLAVTLVNARGSLADQALEHDKNSFGQYYPKGLKPESIEALGEVVNDMKKPSENFHIDRIRKKADGH
jgi:hypothetical protein